VVATGALRGLGDTQSAMKAHFFGYWMVGLPMGYLLCFQAGWGVPGIWVGLTVALIIIGVLLVWVWRRRIGRLTSRLTS
jgi:MATE family multidrug resistance protein